MTQRPAFLDHGETQAVKGVALIFMFVHHFFTFPEFYVAGIAYPGFAPYIRFFRVPLRICVGIFAFLTGYFYRLHPDKKLSYSMRKIARLLCGYWIVYLPLFAFAVGTGTLAFSADTFLKGLLGFDNQVMIFCWYVPFYCAAMLLLPLLRWYSFDTFWKDALGWLVLPGTVFGILFEILDSHLGLGDSGIGGLVQALQEWLPVMGSGLLCAKYRLFEKLRLPGRLRIPVSAVLCCAAFWGRMAVSRVSLGSLQVGTNWISPVFSLDILYAPLFIFGCTNLLRGWKRPALRKPLEAVGKQSMMMWFLHCAFFNCSKELTQTILYFPQNAVLVLLWGLTLCHALARILDWPVKKLFEKLFR